MKLDPGTAASLSAALAYDLKMIRKWGLEIDLLIAETNWTAPDTRDLIAQAYHLHNIYNALENSFEQISRAFENHVEDSPNWHKTLLNKMFLEIPGFRPDVLPESCRPVLHDLRGFRHVFRHSYGIEFDKEKIRLLATKWSESSTEVLLAIEAFQSKVQESIGS